MEPCGPLWRTAMCPVFPWRWL